MGVIMKRRLKIAMVVDILHGFPGGGMVSTERIVERLLQNHTVTVISADPASPENVSVHGFYPPIHRIKKLMDKIGFVFALPDSKKLRKIIQEVDIVHVQLPFWLGQRAITIARKLRKPVISSFHLQVENILYNLNISNDTIEKLLYHYFLKRVYNRSDAVICPSEFAHSELEKYGLTVPGIVVSNGITEKFHTDPTFTRSTEKFVLFSVGRFAPEKRQEVIIEAIKHSKYAERIELILSGRGVLESKLQKAAESLPRKAKIAFLSEEELISSYHRANLYIHASEVELESLSVLEAMGCGLTPLISNSPTSAASQFAHNEQFLFNANDPIDLASKIDYWFEHDEELSDWHKRTSEKAKLYRIDKSIEKLERLYSDYSK